MRVLTGLASPTPRHSAEGCRARLGREHPTLSRWIGRLSVVLLVVSLLRLVMRVDSKPLEIVPTNLRPYLAMNALVYGVCLGGFGRPWPLPPVQPLVRLVSG